MAKAAELRATNVIPNANRKRSRKKNRRRPERGASSERSGTPEPYHRARGLRGGDWSSRAQSRTTKLCTFPVEVLGELSEHHRLRRLEVREVQAADVDDFRLLERRRARLQGHQRAWGLFPLLVGAGESRAIEAAERTSVFGCTPRTRCLSAGPGGFLPLLSPASSADNLIQ